MPGSTSGQPAWVPKLISPLLALPKNLSPTSWWKAGAISVTNDQLGTYGLQGASPGLLYHRCSGGIKRDQQEQQFETVPMPLSRG